MRFALVFLVLMVFATDLFAQQSRGAAPVVRATTLDKFMEYKDKNLSATSADGEITYRSMLELDEQLERATSLYMDGKYALAYPLVAELSQWGVKKAQMLLGDMFIHGRYTDKSVVKGLAWLGTAKEKGFEPQAEKIYDHVYKQLDKDQRTYIDNEVASYIAKFGLEAQQYRCKRVRTVGSNIPVTECERRPNANSTLHPIP